mmetsp:Transcript_14573/g.24455  ORF Transcript_14573/g.24455 Transcript_14573/m.24455 type:complete len:206 (-) Transcript_14573:752-1369(-)
MIGNLSFIQKANDRLLYDRPPSHSASLPNPSDYHQILIHWGTGGGFLTRCKSILQLTKPNKNAISRFLNSHVVKIQNVALYFCCFFTIDCRAQSIITSRVLFNCFMFIVAHFIPMPQDCLGFFQDFSCHCWAVFTCFDQSSRVAVCMDPDVVGVEVRPKPVVLRHPAVHLLALPRPLRPGIPCHHIVIHCGCGRKPSHSGLFPQG